MFFCLWIPQFAAWALEQSEPSLAQRPFAVSQCGKVVAVSPQAYEAGVRAGMSDRRAQSYLASLLIVARDASCETLVWGEVQKALARLTPQIEAVSPGLLFADLKAEKVLPMLRQWNIFGGLARDRATAHLAALTARRGSALCIREKREAPFADRVPLDVTLEAGVLPKSLHALLRAGCKNIGLLRVLSRRHLEEQFGPDGLTLYRLSQGPLADENLRPITPWTPPEELSAALSFEFPAREPGEWEGALDQVLKEVGEKLGSRSARTLEVRIETPLQPLATRCILKESVSQERLPIVTARAVLAEALTLLAPLPPVVTSIEVRLGALTSPDPQGFYFDDEKIEKTSRIHAALKGIESRFASKTAVYTPEQLASPFPEEIYRWFPALETTRLMLYPHVQPTIAKIIGLQNEWREKARWALKCVAWESNGNPLIERFVHTEEVTG